LKATKCLSINKLECLPCTSVSGLYLVYQHCKCLFDVHAMA